MQPYVLIITALIDLILSASNMDYHIIVARGQDKLIGKLAHVLPY